MEDLSDDNDVNNMGSDVITGSCGKMSSKVNVVIITLVHLHLKNRIGDLEMK